MAFHDIDVSTLRRCVKNVVDSLNAGSGTLIAGWLKPSLSKDGELQPDLPAIYAVRVTPLDMDDVADIDKYESDPRSPATGSVIKEFGGKRRSDDSFPDRRRKDADILLTGHTKAKVVVSKRNGGASKRSATSTNVTLTQEEKDAAMRQILSNTETSSSVVAENKRKLIAE